MFMQWVIYLFLLSVLMLIIMIVVSLLSSSCGAPVNTGGTFAAHSEGHSSGPSQRDNEGGYGSRGTRSSWWDNLSNCISRFLANPRNVFFVFLTVFVLLFFLFIFSFLCLFVFVFYVKGCRGQLNYIIARTSVLLVELNDIL